jgi:hypothetical protein
MLLKIKRSQRTSAGITTKIFYVLDARAELTPQELNDVKKYKLGDDVLYNSKGSREALEKAAGHGAVAAVSNLPMTMTLSAGAKALAYRALSSMHLNITINGLIKGVHVECKDMDELLGAEEAVLSGFKSLKSYLDTAATFDGREVVIGFDKEGELQPVTGSASPPQFVPAAAPVAPAPAIPSMPSAIPPVPNMARDAISEAQPALAMNAAPVRPSAEDSWAAEVVPPPMPMRASTLQAAAATPSGTYKASWAPDSDDGPNIAARIWESFARKSIVQQIITIIIGLFVFLWLKTMFFG